MEIIFALPRLNCENDWISGRQKPDVIRMRTERLKKTVGLHVYYIKSLRLKYTNSNNGLNYLIEKVHKILLICERAILVFLNVDFISVGTVNLL